MAKPPLILVVDDGPSIVHVRSVKLREAGSDVRCAKDGQADLTSVIEYTLDPLINKRAVHIKAMIRRTFRPIEVLEKNHEVKGMAPGSEVAKAS